MHLTVSEATALAIGALRAIGFNQEDASTTAAHLVDAAMRGFTFGGLPRILTIREQMLKYGDLRRPISILTETSQSALLDGGENVGYVVAHRATTIAIEKAKRHGMALVGAKNTQMSGLMAHYLEMATREDLVGMATGHAAPLVAPFGSREARLGTNPIAFGFPSIGDPIIWDIGTSAIMRGEVLLRQRLGEELPEGVAIDEAGNPTRDPSAALAGAFLAWGGHRGSGLSIAVQLLAMLCDAPAMPTGSREWAFLFLAFSPSLLMSTERFKERAAEFAEAIRGAAPVPGGEPVRMPFDRSAAERRRRLVEGIDLPDQIYEQLARLRDAS